MPYMPSPPYEDPKQATPETPLPDETKFETIRHYVKLPGLKNRFHDTKFENVQHDVKLPDLKSRPPFESKLVRKARVGQETLQPDMVDMTDFDTMHLPPGEVRRRGIFRVEWLAVGCLLAIAFLTRWYAAMHAGLEVDEPIYHNAAIQLLRYGFPTIRPAYQHPITPFLYHPPFFFFLLAGWFRLWGNTSYFAGRMLSVVVSCIVLLQLYLLLRRMAGRLPLAHFYQPGHLPGKFADDSGCGGGLGLLASNQHGIGLASTSLVCFCGLAGGVCGRL